MLGHLKSICHFRVRFLPYLFLCLVALTANAAKWSPISRSVPTVKFGYISNHLDYKLQAVDGSNAPQLLYQPNTPTKAFVGLAYDGFGASFSYGGSVDAQSERMMGKTTATDYQLRLNFPKFTLDFFGQKYKGYFLENTSQIDTSVSASSPRFQYPDMQTEHLGFGMLYNFHSDAVSLPASFDHTAQQNEPGIALLGYAGIDYLKYSFGSSPIPSAAPSGYDSFRTVRSSTMVGPKLGVGFGFNAPWRGFYFAGTFLVFTGAADQSMTFSNQASTRTSKSSSGYTTRLSLGYNGDSFLAGIQSAVDSYKTSFQKIENSLDSTESSIFIGFRWH